MKTSLGIKLSGAFVALSLLMLAAVSVLANVILNRQFHNYVIDKQTQLISDTVALIDSRGAGRGGEWNMADIETAGMNALTNGLILRLEGPSGTVIWDAREHNGGMCAAILQHMADNMASSSPGFSGGYVEKRYPLASGGAVTVGYYGPYFFTDADMRFLRDLNSLLIWSALPAAAAAMALGLILARRLTRPIRMVTGAAGQIARGGYDVRVPDSDTKEIAELSDSINRLAGALAEQEALRRRLTEDVAHELRTPLATLQSHLEAMIDGVWQPDEARLVSCHEEVVRLSGLVGGLEQLAQYESEPRAPGCCRFDLSATLGRIMMNFENAFRSAGVALAFTPLEAKVCADEDKISQVFVNLMSNALKYTGEGGSVRVQMQSDAVFVRVSVADTGIGIPPEDLPHIFERFYRTDRSRSRRTGGSGIGLAIAKSIVDAYGGQITARSEPERGSTFTVSLPQAQ